MPIDAATTTMWALAGVTVMTTANVPAPGCPLPATGTPKSESRL